MLKNLIAFLGRLLLSLIFLASGVNKIMNWQATGQTVDIAMNEWLTIGVGMEWLEQLISMAIPMVPALLVAAVVCELLGGLCVLLGIQVRFGAFLLILFLIPATLLMHHFWTLQGAEQELQMVMFMKNVAIGGGLLILLAYGKGKKAHATQHAKKDD